MYLLGVKKVQICPFKSTAPESRDKLLYPKRYNFKPLFFCVYVFTNIVKIIKICKVLKEAFHIYEHMRD